MEEVGNGCIRKLILEGQVKNIEIVDEGNSVTRNIRGPKMQR